MDFPESVKLTAKRLAHFCCVVCHEPWVEVHHIKPKAEGGLGVLDNAAPLCGSCHKKFGGNPELRKQLRERRDWWWERCAATTHVDVESSVAQRMDEIHVAVLEGQKRQEDALSDVKGILVQQLEGAQQKIMASESVPDALAVAADAGTTPASARGTLKAALAEMYRIEEEEFAGVSQWYFSLPADERKTFEEDVKRLAKLANQLSIQWSMFINARLSYAQYDEEGNEVFGIGANQPPDRWVHAIAKWNAETD